VLIAGATDPFAGNSINLAMPRLKARFGTDLAATQWVATGFQIGRTLVVPILGWLGGMLGNRNLFVAMIVGFLISTIGCGLSTSLGMLIVSRLLQGLVLGPMEAITPVILVEGLPPASRRAGVGAVRYWVGRRASHLFHHRRLPGRGDVLPTDFCPRGAQRHRGRP
jgi:MFS family permease